MKTPNGSLVCESWWQTLVELASNENIEHSHTAAPWGLILLFGIQLFGGFFGFFFNLIQYRFKSVYINMIYYLPSPYFFKYKYLYIKYQFY